MRIIREKINEERIKSISLRNIALGEKLEIAKEIREEQQKHYDKFLFFKNLNKALEKEDILCNKSI